MTRSKAGGAIKREGGREMSENGVMIIVMGEGRHGQRVVDTIEPSGWGPARTGPDRT